MLAKLLRQPKPGLQLNEHADDLLGKSSFAMRAGSGSRAS